MTKKSKIGCLVLVALAFLSVIVWYLHRTSIPVLEPRGPIAHQERQLIFITLLMSTIVVVPVFGLLFTFAWKYRESNTKARYSPELDGSRLAETIWWAVPSTLILVLGVIIWSSSYQLDPWKSLQSANKPVTIQVVALDWKWLFIYPEQNIATVNFVQFPGQTPVNFLVTADAPMNSFWIPQLGGQIYAMPGMQTQLHLLASTDGNFYGSSSNISGSGFAGMHFVAKASSNADFQKWVSSVRHSSSHLSLSQYGQLARPSQNNPTTYYASAETGLFDNIIGKYIGPLNGMPGMGPQ